VARERSRASLARERARFSSPRTTRAAKNASSRAAIVKEAFECVLDAMAIPIGSEAFVKADRPSSEEILDRARSFANEAVFTIALQRRRILSSEPEDETFVMRRWADVQFLLIALRRVRRAGELAKQVKAVRPEVEAAICAFDAAVPSLAVMRNVGEHIEDYATDSGRDRSISRSQLSVGRWNSDSFEWLGHTIDFEEGQKAAENLSDVIRQAHRQVAADERSQAG
jgi:hypothetical protein